MYRADGFNFVENTFFSSLFSIQSLALFGVRCIGVYMCSFFLFWKLSTILERFFWL